MITEEHLDLDSELCRMEAIRGETYKVIGPLGFVPGTAEWMQLPRYAAKHGLTEKTVTNWINKGIIPANCVAAFPEFHDVQLVKDQPYV